MEIPPPQVEKKSAKTKKRKPEIDENAVKDVIIKSNEINQKKKPSPGTDKEASNTTVKDNKKTTLKKKVAGSKDSQVIGSALERNLPIEADITESGQAKPAKKLKKVPKPSPEIEENKVLEPKKKQKKIPIKSPEEEDSEEVKPAKNL